MLGVTKPRPIRHMPELAMRLRNARYEAGLTQDELAERADVHKMTIQGLERGKRKSTKVSTLSKLARALDLTLEDLAAVEESDAAPFIDQYLASDFAKEQRLTAAEVRWLRSSPVIAWIGDAPTPRTFFHMIEALRASGGPPTDESA